ncbi:MAG: hypothetical protein F9K48_09865 [Candidatus Brocadia sp.]|nr:MAG: hypothetical protein F9K48_09865 [Candidatus Brocadia sp.]
MKQHRKKPIILTIAMAVVLCASVDSAEIIYSNLNYDNEYPQNPHFDMEFGGGIFIQEGVYFQSLAAEFPVTGGGYKLSTIELALDYSDNVYWYNLGYSRKLKISLVGALVEDEEIKGPDMGNLLEYFEIDQEYSDEAHIVTLNTIVEPLLEEGNTYFVVVQGNDVNCVADWSFNDTDIFGYWNLTYPNTEWGYQDDPDFDCRQFAFRVFGEPVITNQVPTLTLPDIPPTVVLDTPLTFTATADDPDGDTLTFSLENAPDGATIDPDSGKFSWTPTVVGTFPFKVTVTDANGASDTEEVTVKVVSALEITVNSVMARNSKVWTVTVLIKNPGTTTTAYYVTVNEATLDGSKTNSRLPLVYGAIKPGVSKLCTLQFKNVDTNDLTLEIQGTCSLGGFYLNQEVTMQ